MFSEIGSDDLTGHALAQTSFEFRKGKAFPVISGIVVAAENEETILEASPFSLPRSVSSGLAELLTCATRD
jgi:hypothetical protein